MTEIYFDNAATSKPHEEVLARFISVCRENYGNPSSMHDLGLNAEKILQSCKKTILSELNAAGSEIIFTSGATESNNIAILGYVRPYRNKRVICTKVEHPSVTECYKKLEADGYDVVYINSDKYGSADLDELEKAVNSDTVLVSMGFVNSETGAMNDLAKASRLVKAKNGKTVFHVDAVQGFGKFDTDFTVIGADLYSISAHKLHGVKGVGALVIKKGINVQPMIYGGKQQKNIRSGTENTYGVAAFEEAVKLGRKNRESDLKNVSEINRYLREKLGSVSGIYINTHEQASPYILNLSFTGVMSEVMLHTLEEAGIYVSAGSACSSKTKASAVLTACGLSPERISSAIRLSFSHYSTKKEAEIFAETVLEVFPRLAGIKKKR